MSGYSGAIARHPGIGRTGVRAALTPRLNRFIPHVPTPRQRAFLLLQHLEAFYGGAAGGGKSDALLMAALQFADLPGYSAVIVRRTFAQLSQPGGLLQRARQWLAPTEARYSSADHRWTFPRGATLTFRHLQDDRALKNYQGAEYDFIGIDELTDLDEDAYRFLFSRLRRLKGSSIPPRVRSASNPVGPGRAWVRRRFVIEGRAKDRPFVPARLEDNPHLDREPYEEALAQLATVLHRQLRFGDWTVSPQGGRFAPGHVRHIDRFDLPPTLKLGNYPLDGCAAGMV